MLSKGLFFWGVALLVGAQALQADFSYEQELYTPAGQGEPPRTTRILGFISGLKARAEDHSSKVPNVILTRLDQGVIRLVDLPKKAYVELPIPGMKEEQAQPFPVTATRTTQSKKIGPYQCTRFEVRLAASTLNLWLSTDIDLPSDDVSTYWQAGTRLYPVTLTRQLAKLPGFPVRVEVVSQGVSVVTTVTGITKQEVPAFLFDVPLDFQQGLAVQAPPEPPPQPPPQPPPPKGSKP